MNWRGEIINHDYIKTDGDHEIRIDRGTLDLLVRAAVEKAYQIEHRDDVCRYDCEHCGVKAIVNNKIKDLMSEWDKEGGK